MRYEELLQYAIEARKLAYAPYSNFRVGAALLTRDGKVYKGCNIENAAYGATICAERVAMFKAVSDGQRDFLALCVVADGDAACTPCGACRQVMVEFAPDMMVIMGNLAGAYEIKTASELLPFAFGKDEKQKSRLIKGTQK
ncbi:MAG TPA: cytidine deaminase [Firmicutes bacterium]|nr:cytidine deaminase [Bacillota bacterium]